MKLKHACHDAGQYGLNVSPDEYRDQGIRLLRTSDLTDGRLSDTADGVYLDAPVDVRYQVQAGDLLLSRAGTIGRSYLVPNAGAGSTYAGFLVRFRPSPAHDPRFLNYAIQSKPVQGQVSSEAVTSTIQNFNADRYANLELPDVSTEEQRRIADFLDDRVARIDQIIAARRHQIEGLNEQVDAQWSALDDDLRTRWPMIPIRRVLRSIVDGPFGSSLTSSHYSDEGTRVIRLGNVGLAEFRDDDKAYVPDEYGTQLAAHSVGPGDLVMAGLGDERWPLGRCTVAPPDLGPAIVKADCYRIRLDGRISHAFAATFLSGPWSRAAFRLLARGSTRARLNTDLARGAELPLSPEAVQQRYCGAVQQALGDAAASRTTLEHSIHLLTEYKQSLITAAVTGELDVTTATSGIPG